MNRAVLFLIAITAGLLASGCASSKSAKTEPKKIHKRPWIGGKFESAQTPRSLLTNGQSFAGRSLLVTRVNAQTPLAAAGIAEGDLAVAVDGKNLKSEAALQKVVAQAQGPLKFTICRQGELSDKLVTPGVEKFQKWNALGLAVGLSTRFSIDFFPNPDFNFGPIGFEQNHDRMELRDPLPAYLAKLEEKQGGIRPEGWAGLRSEAGWKSWVGPFWMEHREVIVSQEPK